MDLLDKIRALNSFSINDCWNWSLSCNKAGYGVIRVKGKTLRAHRVIYSIVHDISLDKLPSLDHTCENKKCVNPDHLDLTTHRPNNRRAKGWMFKDGTWFCGNNHKMTDENTIRKDGRERCRICSNNRRRENRRVGK